jgi:hypothetical protein
LSSHFSQSNDTLDDNNCDSAPDLSSYETTWLGIFAAEATARLNAAAPGANLTTADTLNFMQLCGFDSEYSGVLSEFCPLFTETEWNEFECTFALLLFQRSLREVLTLAGFHRLLRP